MTSYQSFKIVKASLSKTSSVTRPTLLDGLIARSSMEREKKLRQGNNEKPTELNFVFHLIASSRGHSK